MNPPRSIIASKFRIAIAALVSPMIAVLLCALVFWLAVMFGLILEILDGAKLGDQSLWEFLWLTAVTSTGVFAFVYGIALVMGLPVYCILFTLLCLLRDHSASQAVSNTLSALAVTAGTYVVVLTLLGIYREGAVAAVLLYLFLAVIMAVASVIPAFAAIPLYVVLGLRGNPLRVS